MMKRLAGRSLTDSRLPERIEQGGCCVGTVISEESCHLHSTWPAFPASAPDSAIPPRLFDFSHDFGFASSGKITALGKQRGTVFHVRIRGWKETGEMVEIDPAHLKGGEVSVLTGYLRKMGNAENNISETSYLSAYPLWKE